MKKRDDPVCFGIDWIGWLSCVLFAAGAWPLAAAAEHSDLAGPEKPHLLVILADDLGWRDVGFHGSEIETPNIDRIAQEGIELNRFYVQPTCSPTRAALMTGKSPMRLGINQPITKGDPEGLALSEKILPTFLSEQGYQPLMVGKWHLGHASPEQFPQARGFEHFYGHVTGGIGYWDHNHGGGHDWQRNGETLREEGYSTRLIADEAIRVLKARDRSRPTFLYAAFNAPHLPNEAPEAALARYAHLENPKRRLHAGMVSELDQAVGRLLETLAEEGMLENTIVFFSSDNGGLNRNAAPPLLQTLSDLALRFFDRPMPFGSLEFLVANVEDGASDNTPLPRGKMSVGEGGARVPAAIWWPGHLEARRHDGFMTISDLLPTILEAIGSREAIPADLDGSSQWAALTDTGESETRDYVTSALDGIAIYRSPWKLVLGSETRLFDIYADPFETQDLSEANPEIVETLAARAETWPRGERAVRPMLEVVLDPDSFGGAEDRAPWADAAIERSRASAGR